MTPSRARPRPPARGFTVVELLLTLVVIGAVAAIAGPRISAMRGGQAVRGARGEVVSTIEAARAAALQRGRPAWVVRRGNTLVAETVDEDGRARVVVATADLERLYGVTLATAVPADDQVTFDGRGLANPRLTRVVPYARYIVRTGDGAFRDSVCVTSLGLILPPGCVP
jgi:prepilin-type N-terminal cleavage/methylation domain-containing protein